MNFDDLNTWAKVLLLKINAITGWVMPEDSLLKIFIDQFRKKLSESYVNCNPDEIEYAFRNYGTVVKDWGKQMNLSLIDEVMIPYLARRHELSLLEEQKAESNLQIENKEDMSHASMTEWFEQTKKMIKEGKIKVEFIPLMLYEWMDDNGNITKTAKEKHEYLRRAVEYRYSTLQQAVESEDSYTNRDALTQFSKMRSAGCFEGIEINRLKELAKKMIFFETVNDSL